MLHGEYKPEQRDMYNGLGQYGGATSIQRQIPTCLRGGGLHARRTGPLKRHPILHLVKVRIDSHQTLSIEEARLTVERVWFDGEDHFGAVVAWIVSEEVGLLCRVGSTGQLLPRFICDVSQTDP